MNKLALLSSVAGAALLMGAIAVPAQQKEPNPASQQQAPQRGENTAGESAAPSARPDRTPQATDKKSARDRGAQDSGSPTAQETKEAPKASPARSSADKERRKGGDQESDERRARDNESERDRKPERARSQKQDEEPARSREDRRQNQRQEGRTTDGDRDRNRTSNQRDRAGNDTERSRANDRERDPNETKRDSRGGDKEVRIAERDRSRVSASFSTTIDRVKVAPVSRTRVSVSIGARVPTDIRVYDVPTEVVTLYPRFRGHKFVVVDEEIVILHPQRREIVATLPRTGAPQARAGTTGARSGSIGISDERRVEIREVLMSRELCRYEQRLDFTIGIPLPKTVEICEFPEQLVSDIPEIRSYRYVVRDDRVLIVDPDGYRVVDIIE